jgi:putative Holliday junction resolvase
MSEFRRGVRFALDLGQARIGVARCDASGVLCSPVGVWAAISAEETAKLLQRETAEDDVLEVIVGMPHDLKGNESLAGQSARAYAEELKVQLPHVVFRLVDERLTTKAARQQLRTSGYTTKTDKSLIDAVAACVLLEDALESERRTGRAPGEMV